MPRGRRAGLIPARGETTRSDRDPSARAPAHPRSRGDDLLIVKCTEKVDGSSPLAGRRRRAAARRGPRDGLIPARGETTRGVTSSIDRRAAHPRSRGDDTGKVREGMLWDGSSPLAGRRRPHLPPRRAPGGLIPARGETTATRSRPRVSPAAHPRSRGDDTMCWCSLPSVCGSSPLAGRRLLVVVFGSLACGLIPARGETTWCSPSCFRRETAHPRSRGDDVVFTLVLPPGDGSSPLAGRRRRGPARRRGRGGLIPARGETTRT